MRKRNYTVTVRMNKAEHDLLQKKVRESGRTQQAVIIAAIIHISQGKNTLLYINNYLVIMSTTRETV